MVHRGDNGGHLVRALRQTASDVGIKLTLGICFGVEANEECKLGGVGRGGLRKLLKSLDYNVGVTLNLAGCGVDLLGSSEVIGVCINKEPGLESLDGQRHLERGVRWKNSQIIGANELGGGHIRG